MVLDGAWGIEDADVQTIVAMILDGFDGFW